MNVALLGARGVMSMRKLMLAMVSATALLAVQIPSASASTFYTFDWSYSDGGANTGNGTLTAYFNSGVTYVATAMTGTANGQTIVSLSDFQAPDDYLFYPAVAELDTIGISFSVGDGSTSYALYEDAGLYDSDSPYYCGGFYCLFGPGPSGDLGPNGETVVPVDFSLTLVGEIGAAPLPAALPLFATGLGVIGFLVRRRNRKNAALAGA